MSNRILIIGAGLTGLALASGLRNGGVDPVVVEQAPVITEAGWAIGLSPRHLAALDRLGLTERGHWAGYQSDRYLMFDGRTGLVDRVAIFIAPMLIGGEGAPTAIGGHGLALPQALRLIGVHVRQVGQDWFIEADVARLADSRVQDSRTGAPPARRPSPSRVERGRGSRSDSLAPGGAEG